MIVATGSEVALALEARAALAAEGSTPRWSRCPPGSCSTRSRSYRAGVLPAGLPTVSVEAGVAQGWERYADRSVALRRFGASAPAAEVFERLGITPEAVVAAVRSAIEHA